MDIQGLQFIDTATADAFALANQSNLLVSARDGEVFVLTNANSDAAPGVYVYTTTDSSGFAQLGNPAMFKGAWASGNYIVNDIVTHSGVTYICKAPVTSADSTPDAATTKWSVLVAQSASSFSGLSGKPTTIAGYGITDAYTKTEIDTAVATTTPAFTSITGKPTTLSGYGITDAAPKASPTFTGTVTVPTPSNSTDAVTKAYVDSAVASGGSVAFTSITGKPTTLSGYVITDAATTTALALKANLVSPTFTGTVTVPSPVNATDATTKTYVDTALALKANLAGPTFTGTTTAAALTVTGATVGFPYDIAFSVFGVPANAATLARFVAVRAFTIPANLSGTYAKSATASTGSTALTIAKNGTTVATITFASAGTTGTFSTQAVISFVAGDILTVTGPATADTTWGNAEITLAATTA